ncbi:hypothetical protein FMUAM8_50550 [Nocardia cyriacigeorgica]|nr:hypothetical protein FMUAM8_50550 [Nocardia cyriacigeorgica]BDU08684.1 hypothetical protein FMUBM48_49470 [Nocardia cyriacigeorgica]
MGIAGCERRETGRGRVVEEIAHIDGDAEGSTDAGEGAGGDEGVAAACEEIVVGADAVVAEQVGEDGGDGAF